MQPRFDLHHLDRFRNLKGRRGSPWLCLLTYFVHFLFRTEPTSAPSNDQAPGATVVLLNEYEPIFVSAPLDQLPFWFFFHSSHLIFSARACSSAVI
jgi:hypothetical protein